MKKNLKSRAMIIIATTLVSLLLIFFPRTADEQGRKRTGGEMLKDFTSWSAIKSNVASHIKLGLDLRGGTHLVMQVQTEDVIKHITENSVHQAEDALKKANIPIKSIASPANGQVNIELTDSNRYDDALAKLKNEFGPDWETRRAGSVMIFSMSGQAADFRRQQAFKQAMEIIESRVNAFGVSEPTIQSHGADRAYQILLQLPGVDD